MQGEMTMVETGGGGGGTEEQSGRGVMGGATRIPGRGQGSRRMGVNVRATDV